MYILETTVLYNHKFLELNQIPGIMIMYNMQNKFELLYTNNIGSHKLDVK